MSHSAAPLAAGFFGCILLASNAILTSQRGEPPAVPASSFVTGSGNFSPMVANLDKTVEFFHDVLGLTLSAAESARPVPWDAEPWHRGSPCTGARGRQSCLRPNRAAVGGRD